MIPEPFALCPEARIAALEAHVATLADELARTRVAVGFLVSLLEPRGDVLELPAPLTPEPLP
jgi:hypothetical protein